MKVDPCLFNFISPVTGRILCDEDHVLVGDSNGVALPSLVIPIGALTDLPNEHLWIGNSSNRPVALPTIQIDNLPGLTFEATWVGDIFGRPVETFPPVVAVDFTSYVLRSSTNPGFPATTYPRAQFLDLLGLGGIAKIVPGGVNGSSFEIAIGGVDYVTPTELEDAIGIIEDELEVIQDEIVVLQDELAVVVADVAALDVALTAVVADVAALDIVVDGLVDDVAILDADVAALDIIVGGLVIDVIGINIDIAVLRFDLDNLELQNIPAGGDVSLSGFKLINVGTPTANTDAANKIYVDNAVAGGSPITLTGAVTGTGSGTIATTLTDITTSQITDFNTAVTAFRLDEFAAPNISLSMGSQLVTDVLNPISPQDAATKDYVDVTIANNVITLTGAVTGSGAGTINTTLTDITTSQITDFDAAVTAFRLDEFVAPAVNVSFNSQRLVDLADPIDPQDAVTKQFVENTPFGSMSLINNATDLIVTAGISNATSSLAYVVAAESREFDMPVVGNLRCTDTNNYIYRIICTLEGTLSAGATRDMRFNIRRNRGGGFLDLDTSAASEMNRTLSRVITLQTTPTELQQNDTLELRVIPDQSTPRLTIINVSMYALKL